MKKKLAILSLLMILFGTAVWAQLVPTLPAKDLGFDSICFEAATQDVCLSSDGSGNLTINDVGIGALPGFVFSTTGTSNRITATPTTGAVVVDISSSYVGQTSITTLGTITTGVWNGTSIADGFLTSSYLFADGTRGLSGNWDAGSFKITALQFESDIVTGTAPLIVASTTLVTNLNADLLDGIEGDFYQPRGTTFGSFEEFFNALVTSDGATVTLSIEKSGGGNLTMVFSDGLTTFSADTIALTAGSDASPTENYIYIPQSTKVLTKSTSDWPSAQHIKVGFFLVPSAGFVQTNGVYVNQNWNDPLFDTDNQGHLTNMAERSRLLGAIYHSGIAGNGTQNYLTPIALNVDLKATAGLIYQMHRHTIPVFDTSSGDIVLVKNWSGDAFHDITNLYDIVDDSTGSAINNNKYFNLVLWAVANKTDEFTPMMINLPAGSYNTQAGAESDSSGFDDFTIPSSFKLESSTGFLIARITIRMGTTWSVIGTVDLRGSSVASATGGAASIEVEFADNAFKVFDESDVTRVFQFQASGISTGNTRTITVPDLDITLVDDAVVLKKDGSIALTANWDVGAFTITGTQFISDIAEGTAPFVVTSTTVVANLNVDQVDGKDSTDLVLVDGSQALSADWDAGSFKITAETFESDIATGTAPLTIASTTLVTNLNADLLDGIEAAEFLQRDGSIPLTGDWDAGEFDISIAEIRLLEPSGGGTSYTGFKAPALAGNVIYTLPTADGNANDHLKTNGSAVLSWTAAGTGDLLADGTVPLTADWDVGAFDVRAATITADSLTSGRIVFASTNGLLVDDANLAWDGSILLVTGDLDLSGQTVDVSLNSAVDALNFSSGLLSLNTVGARVGIRTAAPLETLDVRLATAKTDTTERRLFGLFTNEVSEPFGFYFAIQGHATLANRSVLWQTQEVEVGNAGSMRFQPFGGNVLIGTAAFPSGTAGLVLGDGTALSSMGTNTAGIFVNDVSGNVEMFLIDEAGTTTQGSPHNFTLFIPDPNEPFPWDHYSMSPYLGIEIGVDLSRLVRLVEQLTGEQLIYTRQLPAEQHLDWMDTQRTNVERMRQARETWERNSGDRIAPGLPIVKLPPAWMLERLQAQGKWNEGEFQAEANKLEQWKSEDSRRRN